MFIFSSCSCQCCQLPAKKTTIMMMVTCVDSELDSPLVITFVIFIDSNDWTTKLTRNQQTRTNKRKCVCVWLFISVFLKLVIWTYLQPQQSINSVQSILIGSTISFIYIMRSFSKSGCWWSSKQEEIKVIIVVLVNFGQWRMAKKKKTQKILIWIFFFKSILNIYD